MAVRSDVVIDWEVSPRIITVQAPSTTITVQDLNDTLRALEYSPNPGYNIHAEDHILEAEGKFDLGTKLTGISLRFLNAKISFEARAGPTWAECSITGGNISAVDSVGNTIYPIEFTAFVAVAFESDTSAALLDPTDEIAVELADAVWDKVLP